MKTILEIFYLRVVGKTVRYQRKQVNLNRKVGDPDRTIESLIQERRDSSNGEVERKASIIHSTSWRYMQPDKIMLTYVAYSDELKFDEKGKAHSLPLKKLKTIPKRARSRVPVPHLKSRWSLMPCGISPF